MSAWTNGTYTHKGLALLAKLTQGASLEITRAVAGTGYVSEANLARQTAVTGAKQTLSFKAASYPETGVCKLPMFLTNDDVAAAYTAKQIGVYAKDPDEGEILYFICQSQNGTNVPAKTDMPDYSATWTFYFRYGQADNVAVTVDPSHTITQDMLDEVRVIAEAGATTTVKQGDVVVFDNAAELPLTALKLFGKTTQVTTKGINLLNTKNTGTFLNNQGNEKTGVIVPITKDGVYRYYINDSVTVYIGYADSLVAKATHVASCLGNTTAASGTINLKAGQYFLLWFDTGITVKDSTYYFLALGANAEIEPYSGGKPAPSPDYPQELVTVGAGGSIGVKACGKNLLVAFAGTKTINGVTFTGNADGSISVVGTASGEINHALMGAWASTVPLFRLAAKTPYILSGYTDQIDILLIGNTTTRFGRDFPLKTFENAQSITAVYVHISAGVTVNTVIYPQLENRYTPTAFEPYKDGGSLTASTPNGLPGIPVTSGGNYTDSTGQMWLCDEVDFGRGVYVQNIYRKSFDGSETFNPYVNASGDNYFGYWNDTIAYAENDNSEHALMCTRLPMRAANILWIETADGCAGATASAHFRLRISGCKTAEAIKEKLAEWYAAGDPMTILCKIATPIETPIPADELAAYCAMTTQHPNTTICNDAGAWMEAGCVNAQHNGGFRMLLQQINVLKATIASLQSAMETELMS